MANKCDWTMEKAQAWVKEHGEKGIEDLLSLGIEVEEEKPAPKVVSQKGILDDIDYLDSQIAKVGLNDEAEKALRNLLKRLPADDTSSLEKDIKVEGAKPVEEKKQETPSQPTPEEIQETIRQVKF